MKRAAKLYIVTVSLFALIFVSANMVLNVMSRRHEAGIFILMNRVFGEIQSRCEEYPFEELSSDTVTGIIGDVYYGKVREYSSEYGRENLPEKVYFIDASYLESDVTLLNRAKKYEKIWLLQSDEKVAGFVVFEYEESNFGTIRLLINICVTCGLLIALGLCIYINVYVLGPFNKLSAYPEKLSKNQLTEKLPETKNRLFGRFTWGINMLNDKLASDRKRINELSRDHLTMLTTIAHGIKTPVANIKLYADAIETGLYQPDGVVNESDAEVASKISKNADDITEIVKELIDKASGGVVDFEPEIKNFYLSELTDFLTEEYGKRLEVLRIPHEFTVDSNSMIKSDKTGLCRILSQLMENAIKYGNGEGIFVRIRKDEEGYYLSVRNKGKVIDKKELPFIFNSFWRGSNSEGIEGSGIGLFESSEIARRLDGEIYARADAEKGEMEFEVFINGQS